MDLKAIKRALHGERDALLTESQAHSDDRRPVTLDQQSVGRLSRMDAMQVQAMALETERRRQQRIQRIAATLARIDKDEYGFCASCGEAIGEQRLTLDPTTPTCIACARG